MPSLCRITLTGSQGDVVVLVDGEEDVVVEKEEEEEEEEKDPSKASRGGTKPLTKAAPTSAKSNRKCHFCRLGTCNRVFILIMARIPQNNATVHSNPHGMILLRREANSLQLKVILSVTRNMEYAVVLYVVFCTGPCWVRVHQKCSLSQEGLVASGKCASFCFCRNRGAIAVADTMLMNANSNCY